MKLKVLTAIFVLIGSASAQYNYGTCDYKRTIATAGQSTVVTHTGLGTCRYQVFAPVDMIIEAQCLLTMTDCSNSRFFVSRSGEPDLRDQDVFCGVGAVTSKSIGNEIVVALYTSAPKTANFTCTFTAVPLTVSNCDCGWIGTPKIVGGVPTATNEYISHAGIVYATPATPTVSAKSELFCGGTIIHQNWIASAAHCFDAYTNVNNMRALVGDQDYSIGTETNWARVYNVKNYYKHPQYNQISSANDIALVETKDYIRYNLGVGPACLPYGYNNAPQYFDGKSGLTVIGWGTTSFGGPVSTNLLKASMTGVPEASCRTSILTQDSDKVIDSTKICTFGNKVRDSCTKDSGGGLYFRPLDRNYFIGVVNYGIFCASNEPSVNSRVTSYFSYILANTRGAFFCRK